jgi:hypothetical protein
MSARLNIQSGEFENSHWIELPVIRIGRGANCEVCIDHAELPEHAVTIEYRNGRYLAHNRSGAAFFLNGRSVAAGKSESLPAGAELQLDSDVRILLEIDGDPSPTPAPANADYNPAFVPVDDSDELFPLEGTEEDIDEAGNGQPSPKSLDGKTWLQIGVIAICLAGIVAVLVAKSNTSYDAKDEAIPTLDDLFKSAKSTDQAFEEGTWNLRVLRQIQHAERARLRGQLQQASSAFHRLRDEVAGYQANLTALECNSPSIGNEDAENTITDAARSSFRAAADSFILDRLLILQQQ